MPHSELKKKSINSQLIHGTKSKTAPQSRGNRQCGGWKSSQTGMLYGEYLMKQALAEV